MKSKLLFIAIILALLGGIYGAEYLTRPQTNVEALQSTPTTEPITVSELHRLVNLERSKAGLQPLTLDERLNQSALLKAQDMQNDGYYSHVDPVSGKPGVDYIPEAIVCVGGENLNNGATTHTSTETVRSWYDSPSHKELLLKSTSTIVGYAVYGEYIVMHVC